MGYYQTRGLLFEMLCRKLLEDSDYSLVNVSSTQSVQNMPYKQSDKNGAIKVRGRSGWHQIDLPYMYNHQIALINPIRLLGEVKYHSTSSVGLPEMRNFSMACLDVYQNYIVNEDRSRNNTDRTLDQALFISATGYSKGAQDFAYSHNVKLIDASKNTILKPLLWIIERLSDLLENSTSDREVKRQLINDLSYIFRKFNLFVLKDEFTSNLIETVNRYNLNIENELSNLIRLLSTDFQNLIQSSFLASGPYGEIFLFVSEDKFPEEFFSESDSIKIDLYYTYIQNAETDQVLHDVILKFKDGTKYEGTVPDYVKNILQENHIESRENLTTKEHYMSPLTVVRQINGKTRILKLIFSANNFEYSDNDSNT